MITINPIRIGEPDNVGGNGRYIIMKIKLYESDIDISDDISKEQIGCLVMNMALLKFKEEKK